MSGSLHFWSFGFLVDFAKVSSHLYLLLKNAPFFMNRPKNQKDKEPNIGPRKKVSKIVLPDRAIWLFS